ncbi:ATP-binding protein [Dongia sp.]|uniref:PAS domain-containing sensor histidine kinase n=1 Tax=Dongia sp. TaxID=1977262 RepID=UPI0035AF25E4
MGDDGHQEAAIGDDTCPLPMPALPDALERGLADRLRTALWIYDFDRARVIWANQAALKVWRADSIETLRARDLASDMSPAVAARLRQYQEDFINGGATFSEVWTLYPQGQPRSLRCLFSGIRLKDGRMAMFCEGLADYNDTPEALRSAEALLHASVMITLYDLDGHILYSNPAARSAALPQRDDGKGADGTAPLLERLVDIDDHARLIVGLAGQGESRIVAPVRTARGKRWHEITARACQDAATGAPAWLVSEIDVTESKEYQAELEASRAKLEAQARQLREAHHAAESANRAKSQFLAHMSHELRTPLNAIIGFSDVTRRGTFGTVQPGRYGDYAELIHESGRLLLDLINDILDISKIEAGKMELRPAPIDARELAETSIRLISGMAREGSVTLLTDIAAETGPVFGDARALKQIVINLLSNAVKFTPAGGKVTLAIDNHPAGSAITVSDTGIGMNPDEIARALDPFSQIDSSIAQNHRGTGLGLALVKNLVELHGGTLSVLSRPHQGTDIAAIFPAQVRPGTAAEG